MSGAIKHKERAHKSRRKNKYIGINTRLTTYTTTESAAQTTQKHLIMRLKRMFSGKAEENE